jgi:hypothetical protein
MGNETLISLSHLFRRPRLHPDPNKVDEQVWIHRCSRRFKFLQESQQKMVRPMEL